MVQTKLLKQLLLANFIALIISAIYVIDLIIISYSLPYYAYVLIFSLGGVLTVFFDKKREFKRVIYLGFISGLIIGIYIIFFNITMRYFHYIDQFHNIQSILMKKIISSEILNPIEQTYILLMFSILIIILNMTSSIIYYYFYKLKKRFVKDKNFNFFLYCFNTNGF